MFDHKGLDYAVHNVPMADLGKLKRLVAGRKGSDPSNWMGASCTISATLPRALDLHAPQPPSFRRSRRPARWSTCWKTGQTRASISSR